MSGVQSTGTTLQVSGQFSRCGIKRMPLKYLLQWNCPSSLICITKTNHEYVRVFSFICIMVMTGQKGKMSLCPLDLEHFSLFLTNISGYDLQTCAESQKRTH